MRKKILTILVGLIVIATYSSVAMGGSDEDTPNDEDITVNHAPNAPELIPEKSSFEDEVYKCTFKCVDPDGDAVYYKIDWGKKESNIVDLYEDDDEDDGPELPWLGPYESGEEVCLRHTWKERGKYTVTITAKDTGGLMSPDTELIVSYSHVKALNGFRIINLFERLANLFPILKQILGR